MRFKIEFCFKEIIYRKIFITACQFKAYVQISHSLVLENTINNKIDTPLTNVYVCICTHTYIHI